MILSTTPTLEGHPIKEYKGIVTGETIIGANAIKDFMAGLTDFLEDVLPPTRKYLLKLKIRLLPNYSNEPLCWEPMQ